MMNIRGSRAVPGCILHLQTPSPSLYLAGEVNRRFCTFTDKVPVVGRCWWAVPSQGGGDPAFSFSGLLYQDYGGSTMSVSSLAIYSPWSPQAFRKQALFSPCLLTALPRHQPFPGISPVPGCVLDARPTLMNSTDMDPPLLKH